MPWHNIDCGISSEFLLKEKQKSAQHIATEDCRLDGCQDCGVCDFAATKNILAKEDGNKNVLPSPPVDNKAPVREAKYRFTFSKTGCARFLAHLEISAALTRALRRSSFVLSYTSGFHPHPKISFATATAVGMESRQEYMDITAQEYLSDLNVLRTEINALLPEGIEILEIRKLDQGEKAIAQATREFEYELQLPAATDASRMSAIKANIDQFLAASNFSIRKASKGKIIAKDIRPFVQMLSLDRDKKIINFIVSFAQEGSARPSDIIAHVLKSDPDESRQIRVVKTQTLLG